MLKELIQPDTRALSVLKNARILVADERYREQDSLYEMLLQAGCTRLIHADSSDQIIQLLREGYRSENRQIDLLIFSASHPNLDAYQLSRTLSKNDINSTPIMLLAQGTGWWDENVADQAYQAGAIDILFRPLRVSDAIPRVNLALLYRNEKKKRLDQEESLNTELSERRIMETRLNHLLNHDELTGLPSRHRLESALKISLNKSHNLHRTCALLYIDIDHFRIINDTMGHSRGDKLLIRLADLLRQSAPDDALIARIGSDEFGILIDDVDKLVALDLALIISQELDALICGEMQSHMNVNANIGVVMIHPGTDTKTASEVLARGDQACHIAKEKTGKRIYLYNHQDPEIQALQKTRHCVTLVRKAISNDWFELYLQPIVNLYNNSISHYEVLLRLIDNTGEMHSPANFVPAAESSGLINKLDFWVVDHALSLLEQVPMEQANVHLSINLSGAGLQTPALLELIKTKLSFHALNPARIMFELTETAAVKDVQKTRETISKLRAIGCRFAIDDFGTGFSSFNYIKNYPVDFIKIDGTFIRNLLSEASDQILVRSMVDIAHNLGKKVIAEYVENAETMELLRNYHVDFAQGYYLGKPAPAADVLSLGRDF
ncbi:MAG: EAL domain-containing protein [Chromatiales bacterium]|jgi:diguanylate cyclase (GGDEF)-like protein